MASDGARNDVGGQIVPHARSFVVVCDAQAASESSPIAVVSASRPCLPTVGLSPGSSVQSGCDSGTQEYCPNVVWYGKLKWRAWLPNGKKSSIICLEPFRHNTGV